MEKKQTAVEWLVEQIKSDQNQKSLSASEWMQVINQAKQMEKEQLDKAYYKGQESKYIGGPSYCEQYYNEIYNKNKQ